MSFLSLGFPSRVLLASALLYSVFILRPSVYTKSSGDSSEESLHPRHASNATFVFSKALVAASMREDDVSWFSEYFPDWHHHVYVMDDPTAPLTVARNKGRESAAYLTYIIDNYYKLPDVMVFLHALRYQWHNEDPMYDGVPMLQNLRLSHVMEEGYANVRCTWRLGCPNEINPYDDRPDQHRMRIADARTQTEQVYYGAFKELFPGHEPPRHVGVPCGAQFALSRSKVLERSLEDYKHYRSWLWSTPLPDEISGRIMEYSWHIIMGKPAVHCPPAADCFCRKYGLCNLTCNAFECEKRYTLPLYSDIPEGWPLKGAGQNGFPDTGWIL